MPAPGGERTSYEKRFARALLAIRVNHLQPRGASENEIIYPGRRLYYSSAALCAPFSFNKNSYDPNVQDPLRRNRLKIGKIRQEQRTPGVSVCASSKVQTTITAIGTKRRPSPRDAAIGPSKSDRRR
jgi:hypothetical protein